MASLGIGSDRVLAFSFSGVMISIKLIDVHIIGHGRSVGVCVAKRVQIYRIGAIREGSFLSLPRYAAGRLPFVLVLVFAATRGEMALRSGLLIRIGKQNVEILYV